MTDNQPSKLQAFFEQPLAEKAQFNLSQSAAEPLEYAALLTLEPDVQAQVFSGAADYPQRHGSEALRAAIAQRYHAMKTANITVTSGLDDGLALLFLSLVSPGDRVIVLTPSYPPHVLLPHIRGAQIVPWPARAENDWVPDLDELESLLAQQTRLVLVTFPQNPTGFMPDKHYVGQMVALLERAGTTLLCDEIYAGMTHDKKLGGEQLADHYEHAISMHGLSKTLGLPGLRVGWLASRDDRLMAKIRARRELFNCYVPTPVDRLAALALRHEDRLLQRTSKLCVDNLAIARDFFARNDNLFRWRPPMAGVLSFLKWLGPGGTSALSQQLLRDASLALAPSACFDAGDEHVRLSVSRRSFADAIGRMEDFLSKHH